MREERRKKKVLRLKLSRLFMLLAIVLIIVATSFYVLNIRISQIEIIGTNLIQDDEIIEIAGIKDYPPIFSFSSYSLAKKIKTLDLVNDVKISKNLYGKLSIQIDEARVLFYNKTNDKMVLSNEKEIEFSQKYLGIPTLINYVPSNIYTDLINGLKLIDNDVLSIISEIEYSPSKTLDGDVIDDTRFILRMNDTNIVYMNTINVKQLNNYLNITSAILATTDENHGILYLDSSTEENFSFESFASIQRQKEEEEKRLEEEKNEGNNQEQSSN